MPPERSRMPVERFFSCQGCSTVPPRGQDGCDQLNRDLETKLLSFLGKGWGRVVGLRSEKGGELTRRRDKPDAPSEENFCSQVLWTF